jgi:hypothetical protein
MIAFLDQISVGLCPGLFAWVCHDMLSDQSELEIARHSDCSVASRPPGRITALSAVSAMKASARCTVIAGKRAAVADHNESVKRSRRRL